MLGSRITTVAYPLLALRLTGSALAAGWVAFAATAPSLVVYMPAGVLVDRMDPRRTMLLSEFGRGLAIGTAALILLLGELRISALIAVAVIEESLEVVSTLAERVYVRALVDPDEAASALAPIEARTHFVIMTGRPLGGFLFGIAPTLPFLADALSFIFSVGTLISVKSKHVIATRANWVSRQFRNDIGAGLSWFFVNKSNKYARTAVILSSGATLVSQALIIVFLTTAHSQHLSSAAIGMVLAASGLGGVFGSAAASQWTAPPWASLMQLQMLAWMLAFVILDASGGRSMTYIAIVMFILAFTGALGNVEAGTYLMQHVAEGMLARVTSVNSITSFGACAIGPLIGGVLMHRYGNGLAAFWLFFATALLALFSVLAPSMRHREPVITVA
jgi:MFS family permease